MLAEQRYPKRTAQTPKMMPNYSIALIRKTVTKIQCSLMSKVHIQRFTFIFKDWHFCSTNCNLSKLIIWSSIFARVVKRLFDAAKAKWNIWEGGMAIDRAMKLKVRIGLQHLWLPKKWREEVTCKTYQILINVILEQSLFKKQKRRLED